MPDAVSTARIDPSNGRVTFVSTQGSVPLPVVNSPETPSGPVLVQAVSGRNVGLGTGIFAGSDGIEDVVLNFKTILVGNGLRLVDGDDTVLIEASSVNASFVDLLDGPRTIISNALLMGNAGELEWTPVPDTPDLILRWTGGNYQWVRRTTGTVTEVRALGQDGITITSGTLINSVGTIAVGLQNTGVVPGTYSNATVVVDNKGRVLSASNNSFGEVNDGQNIGGGVPLYAGKTGVSLLLRSLRANDPISVSQNGNTVDFTLVPSGVTAGTYTYSSITVDRFGRITAASSGEVTTGVEVRQGVNRVPVAQTLIFTGDVVMASPASGTAQINVGGTSLLGLSNSVTGGAQVFRNTIDRVSVLRRIVGSGTVTVTEQTDSILIAGASGVITVSRNGTQLTNNATTLNFTGLGNVSVSGPTATVSIPSPANVGSGARVYSANTGSTLQFRSITAGAGIAVDENPDNITISSSATFGACRFEITWTFAQPGVWSFTPSNPEVQITRTNDLLWTVTHTADGPPMGFCMIGLGGSGWTNHGSNFTVIDSNTFNISIPSGFGYQSPGVAFSRVIVRFII